MTALALNARTAREQHPMSDNLERVVVGSCIQAV
jgi:hypothetical protein